jgi:hypothetical protein
LLFLKPFPRRIDRRKRGTLKLASLLSIQPLPYRPHRGAALHTLLETTTRADRGRCGKHELVVLVLKLKL